MNTPHITPADGGEYSTIVIGDMIETCWFGSDGTSRVIARTPIATIAREHVDREKWNEFRGVNA